MAKARKKINWSKIRKIASREIKGLAKTGGKAIDWYMGADLKKTQKGNRAYDMPQIETGGMDIIYGAPSRNMGAPRRFKPKKKRKKSSSNRNPKVIIING